VAAAQVIRNRGIEAVGHTVYENVCGDDATGVVRQGGLVGSRRSRKPKK
jgi:putative transposase